MRLGRDARRSSRPLRSRATARLTFNFHRMNHSELSHLQRLMDLAEEAEQILARSISSHDIRHACAVARGYLDLARQYNEPVNIDDVERVLIRMRAMLRRSTSRPAPSLPPPARP